MGILKNFISGEYAVCYRFVPENGHLLFQNDEKTAFRTITNCKRYWYADPMLFEQEGRHFLFFEAYDKQAKLGRIACCELKDDKTYSGIKVVLAEDFHLSYPNVFRMDGKIYMIPETADENRIFLYECVEFPGQWRKAAVLLDGIKAVDSTFFEHDGRRVFSAQLDPTVVHGVKLNLYRLEDNLTLVPHPENPVSNDVLRSRPAGNIFNLNGDPVRPAQDCSGGVYGRALLFNRINRLDNASYTEEPVYTVLPRTIQTNLNKKLTGCHTYAISADHRIEAVDVKYDVTDIKLGIKITVYNLCKKMKLIRK